MNATPSFDVRAFLAELHREIDAHPGVNHVFLARCATNPFTREDYKVCGLQHYPLVGLFTTYMEHLLMGAPNSDCKQWIAKVLVDEYGEGSDGLDHTQLYRQYLAAAGVGPDEENVTPLDHRVVDFVATHLRLVTEEPFLVGLGALGPGHEWAIPKMFDQLILGLRRAGFAPDEMLYFDLHIEQDCDHGAWLEEALADHVKTAEDAAQVRRGALLSLQARKRFWDGVQTQVVAWRQPVRKFTLKERLRFALGDAPVPQLLRNLEPRTVVYRPQVHEMAKTFTRRL